MIQEIITYIIITIATGYTIYNFIKVFIPSKNKVGHYCSGSCASCATGRKSSFAYAEKFKNLKK